MNNLQDIYILNIETATKNCSVSLSKNGNTVQSKEIADINYSHAENLHVFIEEIIQQENISINQINAIAVSEGPGSYTGLRIGVSAAKGLCFALNIPLISINTLEILAKNIQTSTSLIIPVIDARRMEVYSAIINSNYQVIRKTEAEIINKDSYSDIIDSIIFVGDGVTKIQDTIVGENYTFDTENIYPSAKNMSKMSFDKFQKNQFVDVAYFEPFYLKDFFMTK